jgi:outer membrane protein assembly factor BamD (BamD/ComL family)
MKRYAFILAAGILIAGCATVPSPEEIPEDLTQAELFQIAQEAVDNQRYETATVYYETFLERFPDDEANVVAAEYEIAFIQYRQENYERAAELFQDLLDKYEQDRNNVLPAWPRVLATRLLNIMEEERAPASPEA